MQADVDDTLALQVMPSAGRKRLASEAMPPPPVPSRPRRKVLDEYTYVAALESIIARDFFPQNERMRNQLEVSGCTRVLAV